MLVDASVDLKETHHQKKFRVQYDSLEAGADHSPPYSSGGILVSILFSGLGPGSLSRSFNHTFWPFNSSPFALRRSPTPGSPPLGQEGPPSLQSRSLSLNHAIGSSLSARLVAAFRLKYLIALPGKPLVLLFCFDLRGIQYLTLPEISS